MTNKEALEILKTEWDINAEIFDTNFHEALEVAIKALGGQRPHGKWINADVFSDWLKKQTTGFDYNRCEVLVDRNGIWENAIETYLKERSEEE